MPRKPKLINPETQQKINSFVDRSNTIENESSSEEEYNIYVKSARDSKKLEDTGEARTGVTEVPVTSERLHGTCHQTERRKYTKKSAVKIEPTTQPLGIDPNERLYKMFDDYKNELSELKSIVRGNANGVPLNLPSVPAPFGTTVTGTVVKPTNDLDIRRQMFQLKFG